jgi:hypothetical protein
VAGLPFQIASVPGSPIPKSEERLVEKFLLDPETGLRGEEYEARFEFATAGSAFSCIASMCSLWHLEITVAGQDYCRDGKH